MNPAPESWGRLPKAEHTCRPVFSRFDPLPEDAPGPMLPHGLGRSYGDSCLNHRGTLLLTRPLDQFIAFDPGRGLLTCEAGVSLAEILDFAVPRGWFLPVTPGTKHVTLGGAIANDVHGKNHHVAGTFGAHITELELLRSDGTRTPCSRTQNAARFRATVGGLGLTGLITRATLRLKSVHNPAIDHEQLRIRTLAEFFGHADASDATHEYTVAWLDTLASGDNLGRGIFMRGNHAPPGTPLPKPRRSLPLSIPLDAPSALLNRATIRAFNTLYARKLRGDHSRELTHYTPFFYPLDVLPGWNRLYGKRGFFQHQCVVPRDGDGGPIRDILQAIARSREASFLAVLKCFGAAPPEGLLSFPRPGVTLALDFPNRGTSTRELMDELDHIVLQNGGALYPAKDARMAPETFRHSFPALDLFLPHIDPAFSSSFLRRVLETP
jgi:FAD/FMN-containing dehydrogenase